MATDGERVRAVLRGARFEARERACLGRDRWRDMIPTMATRNSGTEFFRRRLDMNAMQGDCQRARLPEAGRRY
jgi:hypothetical protein